MNDIDIQKYNTLMSYDKERLVDIIMAYESINNTIYDNVVSIEIDNSLPENDINK